MAALRPMLVDDVPAVHELNIVTFEALSRERGEEVEERPDPALVHIRYRHLVETDPGGAWVAEHDGEIVACALALRREDVWGLSLLIVHPEHQSHGVGRAILARANEYAEGARGRIILSSPDPRAIRSYARLGLELHPAMGARGSARDIREPAGIREGGAADIPFTAAVDRHVRGAAHGVDVEAQLAMGQTLLIAEERGYAVFGGGNLRMLAAFDDDGARDLLRAALVRAGELLIYWITAQQQWAVDVCLEAGLELNAGIGAVFVDGDVGPFRPYLPSGAFL
jgi:GNAT superfamily N-acetyltransferase